MKKNVHGNKQGTAGGGEENQENDLRKHYCIGIDKTSQRNELYSHQSQRQSYLEHCTTRERGRKLSYDFSLDHGLKEENDDKDNEKEEEEEELNEQQVIDTKSLLAMQAKISTRNKMITGLKEGQQPRLPSCTSSWKWAIDEKSKKCYFYNKITKEVTWVKPNNSSCNKWKVYFPELLT